MKGQRVGYIRVSTIEQNIGRQLENVQLDRVFVDRASGKDKNRPQLKAMLEFVREGDFVVVHRSVFYLFDRAYTNKFIYSITFNIITSYQEWKHLSG